MTYAVNLSSLASNGGTSLATWTTGTRPASPITGQAGFNTTLSSLEVYNGSAWAPAGGLLTQSVQTTGFTGVAGNIYPCNTTSAAFTVTLPASPAVGDQIGFVDYAGTFATNNLTLNPNSLKINGGALNKVMQTNNESLILVYIDSTQGWKALTATYTTTPFVNAPYNATYLVVAGGGAGGSDGGAGGGAGGAVSGTLSITVGTVYTATVGAGATKKIGNPQNSGSNSSLTGVTTAVGGGGAGGWFNNSGQAGGSGGGAGAQSGTAGAGTPGQGNNGGASGGPSNSSGGGGGAGSVGGGASGPVGGSGGTGIASSITGSSSTYAGGGGAVGNGGQPAGTGGTFGGPSGSPGGGANATPNSTPGVAAPADATANTGGGGGGGGGSGASGSSGGSGVVILSVPTANYSGTTTGSPTITTSGSNTIIKFNSSGTYTG